MEEIKYFNAQLSISGYKAVAVIAATIVGVFAATKFVDKLCSSSVVVNAESKNTAGGK